MAVNQTDVGRPARWALGGVDNGCQVVCMPESMGSPEGYLESTCLSRHLHRTGQFKKFKFPGWREQWSLSSGLSRHDVDNFSSLVKVTPFSVP